ncbi:MAG: RNA polymerase sigma factor [Gemmatales bacterium]|nr:RNA polymerase sigma factor [Gemmatales bacterium]
MSSKEIQQGHPYMRQTKESRILPYLLLQGSSLPEWTARTDSELLSDYVRTGNELAFAALVQRHGTMVWNVCRRLVRNYHDAEDAFQATFLVLAKRAAEVKPAEMLAPWLYGVARHTAQKARYMSAKKLKPQIRAPEREVSQAGPSTSDDELLDALYDELAHLPDKFRTVVLLCDLEGHSRKEAARLLKVPEGTVAGWLARARKLLSQRLAQRGWTLSVAGVAMLFGRSAMATPFAPMWHTVRAVGLLQAGQSLTEVVSVKVAMLVSAVLRSFTTAQATLFLGGSIAVVATVLAWSMTYSWLPLRSHGAPWQESVATSVAEHESVPPSSVSTEQTTDVAPPQVIPRWPDRERPAKTDPPPILPEHPPERIGDRPEEKWPRLNKSKPEIMVKKPDAPKAKDPPRKKPPDKEKEDEDDKRKIEGVVSDINWLKGTFTLQPVQASAWRAHTFRFSRATRFVVNKGKPNDILLLTCGMHVEVELSPKDECVVCVKLKPRPKSPEEKKT